MKDKLKIELERLLNELLVKRIIELDLIDTGNLRDNSKIKVLVFDDNLDFIIEAPAYFEFVDAKNNILDFIFDDEKVDDLITDLFFEIIMSK